MKTTLSVTKLQPLLITDLRLALTRLVAGLVLMLVIALPLGFAAIRSSGDIARVLTCFAVSFAVLGQLIFLFGALNLALFVRRNKSPHREGVDADEPESPSKLPQITSSNSAVSNRN
jgi:hypothetical protein